MSKSEPELRGPILRDLMSFMRGLASDIDQIILCWDKSDQEVRELMSIMGPATSGFAYAGRHARRHVAEAIRHLRGNIDEVAPYVDATLSKALHELIDLLDLDEYTIDTYGDQLVRWRQMWSTTGLEKPLLRARRMVLDAFEKGRAILAEWSRYPELGEPSALELAAIGRPMPAELARAMAGQPRSADRARGERDEVPSRPGAVRPEYDLLILERLRDLSQAQPDAQITSTTLLEMGPLPNGLKEGSFKTYWRKLRLLLLDATPPLLEIVKEDKTQPVRLIGDACAALQLRIEAMKPKKAPKAKRRK